MTKNEIMARLEELDNMRFILAMKDRWERDDYVRDSNMHLEELELKKMLEEK